MVHCKNSDRHNYNKESSPHYFVQYLSGKYVIFHLLQTIKVFNQVREWPVWNRVKYKPIVLYVVDKCMGWIANKETVHKLYRSFNENSKDEGYIALAPETGCTLTD